MPFEKNRIDWSKPWLSDGGLVAATQTDGRCSSDIFDASEWPDNSEDGQKIAALVGAAPDLLAALKSVQPYFEGEHAHDHPDCVQLRAAIAKAEGR
jgi:hypothetical protein